MKKLLLMGILINLSNNVFGQINIQDSTVQVVAYWSKMEIQSYNISLEKLKIKGNDTVSKELIKYEVDVKVVDSTENSYTNEWHYKNFTFDTDNELVKKLTSLNNDIKVLIKTDEFGAFLEVVNWQEVGNYINKMTKELEVEIKDLPNHKQIMASVKNMYASKESIEANAIKDAIQFYTFHGVKYKLGEEVEGKSEVVNNFGEKPFETDISYYLDEINEEDDHSIIRMQQTINSKQLTDETYKYLKVSGGLGNNMPARSDFPEVSNETFTASMIHGSTGWVIYSIETKETKAVDSVNVEERIIEIK